MNECDAQLGRGAHHLSPLMSCISPGQRQSITKSPRGLHPAHQPHPALPQRLPPGVHPGQLRQTGQAQDPRAAGEQLDLAAQVHGAACRPHQDRSQSESIYRGECGRYVYLV